MFAGTCISEPAVKLILAPEVIVRSVPSPPIFSAPSSAKCISVSASVTMFPLPAGLSSKFALESVVIELSCKFRLSICTDVNPVSAASSAVVIVVPLTEVVMLLPPANFTEFCASVTVIVEEESSTATKSPPPSPPQPDAE